MQSFIQGNSTTMSSIRAFIESILLIMETKDAILARIELMVAMVAVLLPGVFVIDTFLRRNRSQLNKYILLVLEACAHSMVYHTLGMMRSAPVSNHRFQVWAFLLVVLKYSTNYITVYGLQNQLPEWMMQLGGATASMFLLLDIIGYRINRTLFPLCLLLAWQLLRISYMVFAFRRALVSYWQGKSSALIADYMETENDPPQPQPQPHINIQDRNHSTTSSNYATPICSNGPETNDQPPEVNEIIVADVRRGDQVQPVGRNQRNPPPLRLHNGAINNEDADPVSMRRYRYLISGEIYQNVQAARIEDRFELKVTNEKLLVTLEKVWGCRGKLLENQKLKDLCLSFALYRLLQCQFSNYPLPDVCIPKIRRLLVDSVLCWTQKGAIRQERPEDNQEHGAKDQQDEASDVQGGCSDQDQEGAEERVFRITSAELSFLNDYMYSRFPIIFWNEWGIVFYLLICIAIVGTTFWVGGTIVYGYSPQKNEFTHSILGVNVDVFITWGLLIVIFIKETWEIIIYIFSDWTKIVLISWYVRCNCSSNCLLFRLICKGSVVGKWHGQIDQYNFLEAFSYRPVTHMIAFRISLRYLPEANDGERNFDKIEVSKEVKKAIIMSLRSMNFDEACLPTQMPSLGRNNLTSEICQMCERYPFSHIILVWHIATSLCEIELCQHYNIYLKDSELPSLWSSVKKFCLQQKKMNSQLFLVKQERLDMELSVNFTAANSLSRYCAHLLVKKPDFLPDHIFGPKEIFQYTVHEARNVLKGCDTLQSIYRRLMNEGRAVNMAEKDRTILKLGAKLGKTLLEKLDDATARWKALKEVWADLLVCMAQCSNVKAHERYLATGGELITHVWVLLSHAGIAKNSPEEGEIGSEEEVDI